MSNFFPNKYLITVVVLLLFSGVAKSQENYFYTGKTYGSEALFNPITVMINGGFDIIQLQSVSSKLSDHNYGRMSGVVWNSLTHPFEAINRYGWSKLVTTELLPLNFTKGNMQWIPNYQQHLIGGGMIFAALKEWYRAHNVPWPWLFSAATVMGYHYVNEILETGTNEAMSVDEVVDLYIFDVGGIILFSFDAVNKFFSRTLNLSDWSSQAGYIFPEGRINAGQYFSMKWKLPFSDKYSLFYRYGLGGVLGLSRKMNATDHFSFGLGFKTKHLIEINANIRYRTIETAWFGGIFYDRNNSLLASFLMSGLKEQFIMIDIYPGIIHLGDFSPGIWATIGRHGITTIGVSSRYVLSIGYEFKY